MRREVIYTRRYIRKPIRVLLWVLFIGIVIQSVIHTFTLIHSIQTRSQNVHTRSNRR